jgi:hypothetical protein
MLSQSALMLLCSIGIGAARQCIFIKEVSHFITVFMCVLFQPIPICGISVYVILNS